MENLIIERTEITPSVYFNKHGMIMIAGKSFPENAPLFYAPLMEMADNFISNNQNKNSIQLVVELERLNMPSYRSLHVLIKKLHESFIPMTIQWAYDEADYELRQLGEHLRDSLNLEIDFRALDSVSVL